MSQCLRMTPEEFMARQARRVRRSVVHGVELPGEQVERASKYKNIKTNGYASGRESAHAQILKMLERAGEITELVEQPRFLLIPAQPGIRATHYFADFSYTGRDGVKHVVDCKGFRTPVYLLKRKLMLFVHGITVEEV